eukprot:COSAG01_NODE_3236_length_6351_cov_4.282823_2_plen_112_part_00
MEGGDWGACLELPMADEDGEDSESGLFSSSSSELNWQAGCEDRMAMNDDVMASQHLLHRPSTSMRPSQLEDVALEGPRDRFRELSSMWAVAAGHSAAAPPAAKRTRRGGAK